MRSRAVVYTAFASVLLAGCGQGGELVSDGGAPQSSDLAVEPASLDDAATDDADPELADGAGLPGEAAATLDVFPDEDDEDCNAGRGCVIGAAPGAVLCIVYLQPHPSSTSSALTNPLFTAVQTFVKDHAAKNEAFGYPPHISMIGFFVCTNPLDVAKQVESTLRSIGQPLGRPIIQSVDKTSTKKGQRTVRLTTFVGPTTTKYFNQVIRELRMFFPHATSYATTFPVANYHVTLALGHYTKTEIDDIATDAHRDFDPTSDWNATTEPGNMWDIVVFQTQSNGALPLRQVQRFRVYPELRIEPPTP